MRVAAYARFSSDNQREESVEAQLRAIKRYCIDKNYTLVKIYEDHALTGRTDKRTGFQQMIEDGSKGLFESVIVYKFERFARNKYDSVRYKFKLRQQGVKVISVLEPLDGSPESVLLESLYEGMAEYYSLNLAREVMKGMMENVEQQLTTGGRPPLGYTFVNKKYTINDYEAEAVRIIFTRYASGSSYSEIVEELNNKGYKTREKRPFVKNSLTEILRNERYIGNYIYKQRTGAPGQKRNTHAKNPDLIRIEGAIPAIINKDLWEVVQNKMKTKKRKGVHTVYLLSGKLICGECGSKMHGNRHTGGRNKEYVSYGYRCAGKCGNPEIEKDLIEKMVIDVLRQNIGSATTRLEIKEKMADLFEEKKETKSGELIALEKELKETKDAIEGILQAIMDGMYAPAMKERMYELESKKAEIEYRLESAKKYIAPTLNMFEEYLDKILKFETMEEIQIAIETLVDFVEIKKDWIKVEILLNSSRGNTWCTQGHPTINHESIILLKTVLLQR